MLAAALTLAACSKPQPPATPVRAVKLMTVGEAAHQASIQYAGVVTARSETALGFRVAGKLLSRPVTEGQAVRKGQLLAQLDPTDYQLAAAAAQAQWRAATTDRDLQAADVQRYRELRAQNFISAAELDRRVAALKAAESRVEEARAQLATQGNQADYTRLVADADAIVTATLAEPGQVVAAGAPVVRLAFDGARDVSFAVPEQRLAQVQVGQQVTVRAWADQASRQPARVREIAGSADAATRTFGVKVEILTEPQPPLGATVTVDWPQAAAAAQVIRLPSTAIRRDAQGGNAVWVYDAASGTVKHRAVALGDADRNDWIVNSGLQPGDQVVTAGVHVLQDGEKVTVYRSPVPPDTPGDATGPGSATGNAAAPAMPAKAEGSAS
ncbi:efflux RND transporter periplasmic adaptor subunit [Corticibacter populi]|uniref:Efflux RND transporter periplasmic adaptor subunit n=1 Tax=Corticibacter populi TaxID=1550736 RepID=A0A3M6QU34_9BURK|nr:efflux RND transporter periplasmic adaptor subunit [Corticibacter populi]